MHQRHGSILKFPVFCISQSSRKSIGEMYTIVNFLFCHKRTLQKHTQKRTFLQIWQQTYGNIQIHSHISLFSYFSFCPQNDSTFTLDWLVAREDDLWGISWILWLYAYSIVLYMIFILCSNLLVNIQFSVSSCELFSLWIINADFQIPGTFFLPLWIFFMHGKCKLIFVLTNMNIIKKATITWEVI